MPGGLLIREARLRAGLTQAELARRLATSSAAISRWEHGAVSPSYDAVVRAARACGLRLVPTLLDMEPHDESLLDEGLSLSLDQRLGRARNAGRFVLAGRRRGG